MEEEELKPQTNIWLPEIAGEILQGRLVEVKEGIYGTNFVIEKADGEKIVTPSHRYLIPRLMMADIGDNLKLEYLGQEPPKLKGQQGMRLYKVTRIK